MNSISTNQKVLAVLQQKGYVGMMIWGNDNFTYITQLVIPFAPSLPHKKTVLFLAENNQVILCPKDYAQYFIQQGWTGEIVRWQEDASVEQQIQIILSVISKYFPKRKSWNIDSSNISQSIWNELNTIGLDISCCDGILRELRMVKQDFEIMNLTWASRMAERGIVSALNHAEGTIDAVSYSLAETAERMRVHVAEFGGQAVGQVLALQGSDLQAFHGINHNKIRNDNLLRYDITTSYKGYWASSGRTVYVGKPPHNVKQAYRDNLTLKNIARKNLQPGIACNELFSIVEEASLRLCIPFHSAAGIGYGVGTSERESPFLNKYDKTILLENTIIALDVWTFGPNNEWIHSIDTYQLDNKGNICLSWYRDYDRLYELVGITARHG